MIVLKTGFNKIKTDRCLMMQINGFVTVTIIIYVNYVLPIGDRKPIDYL